MRTGSLDKQKLFKGLGMALGELIFGLSGPWWARPFGLNVPEGAAAGVVIGAVIGYYCARWIVVSWNRRHAASGVPDVTGPEASAGLDGLHAGRAQGAGAATGSLFAEVTRQRIEAAIWRFADDDAADIHVEVRNQKVVLKGSVHSWRDEAEAERIAFDMPGIQEVDNRLEVVP
jgi:hypothetical protein